MSKRKAFTLAEILVTLGLIGVVAALTIPFLLQEFNKSKWAVTYQRSFAETFNVLGKIALSEDCAKSLTCTHVFDNGQMQSTRDFGDELVKNMAVSQNCGTNNGNCFSHSVKIGLSTETSQTLQETMADAVAFNTPFYTFKTTRGVSYAVLSFGLKCLNENIGPTEQAYIDAYVLQPNDPTNQMLSLCGFIILDVNGEQSPNTWGRDVFGMWITDRGSIGVYPFGGDLDKKFNGQCHFATDGNQDTRGCAAQLVKDGWKMKY